MKKVFYLLGFLLILSPILSLEEACSMEEEEVLFETRKPSCFASVFPHLIAIEKGNSRVIFSREFSLPHYNSSEGMEFPLMPINFHTLNRSYRAFKNRNTLEYFCEGIEVRNLNGVLYIEDEKAFRKRGDFLREWRYVLDENCRLFVSQEVNHAGLLGGQYVLGAGTLKFDENGKICFVDNFTGHIASNSLQLKQVIVTLSDQGMLSKGAITSRWDQHHPISCSEFLAQDFSEEQRDAVAIPLGGSSFVERFEKMAVPFPVLCHERSESLTLKALEILSYIRAEERCEAEIISHGGVCPDLEEELQRLRHTRPYGDLFNQVWEIEKHAIKERLMNPDVVPCHLVLADPKEIEDYKRHADEETASLKQSRPFPELWDILMGK